MFFQEQYRDDGECRAFSAIRFREADPAKLAADTGIMAHAVQDFQKAIQKKRDTAVIRIEENYFFLNNHWSAREKQT